VDCVSIEIRAKLESESSIFFAVQRCTVANSLANSSVSGNGKPVILAMQHEGWNGSAASRTLPDVGMGDLHSNGSRLKIFSGTANPQLSQVICKP
jgi:hypothetical protein